MVSIDPADKLKEMRNKLGLTFTNLMDPGSETIKRYGILNVKNGKIPHPTTLVVDRQGIIRFIEVDENYRVRPSSAKLIDALKGLPGA